MSTTALDPPLPLASHYTGPDFEFVQMLRPLELDHGGWVVLLGHADAAEAGRRLYAWRTCRLAPDVREPALQHRWVTFHRHSPWCPDPGFCEDGCDEQGLWCHEAGEGAPDAVAVTVACPAI